MTTDGSEYLVRCFAYSKEGQRCEQLAGHDGNHAIVKEWTDEECFVPGAPAPRVYDGMASFPAGRLDDPPAMPSDTEECLICDHRMHRGMCRVDECDCKNGIPK